MLLMLLLLLLQQFDFVSLDAHIIACSESSECLVREKIRILQIQYAFYVGDGGGDGGGEGDNDTIFCCSSERRLRCCNVCCKMSFLVVSA